MTRAVTKHELCYLPAKRSGKMRRSVRLPAGLIGNYDRTRKRFTVTSLKYRGYCAAGCGRSLVREFTALEYLAEAAE